MPLPDELTVEVALAELREMFPDKCVNLTISIGGGGGGQHFSLNITNPDANGTDWGSKYCGGPTLDEAMQQVRTWKETQK